jgi:Guanylate kinase
MLNINTQNDKENDIMIKKEFWKKFTEENIAVSCNTFGKAKDFTEQFIKNVNVEDRIIERKEYGIYGSNTCICCHKNDDTWAYACKGFYLDDEYTIVNYDDILDLEEYELGANFKIIAMVGCSASGKDSIQERLVELGFVPITSHTSRPMRNGEVDGVQYHFVDKDEASKMLSDNEFIEHRVYHVASGEDWIYGISKQVIEKAYVNEYVSVVIVDFNGLKELERYLESKGLRNRLTSIYVNATPQTRLIRSLSREGEMTPDQIEEVIRRYNDDKQNVEPAIFYCDIVIKNETKEHMDKAVKIIQSIVRE